MFCPKCGTQLPNDAVFCSNCGSSIAAAAPVAPQAPTYQAAPVAPQAPTYQAPAGTPVYQTPVATAPVQPSAVVKVLGSFANILKGIFSNNAVTTIGNQAKNTGLEWIIGIILAVLSFSFAMPVTLLELLPEGSSEDYPFFGFFGMSMLLSVLVLGATAAGIWLMANIVTKKNVRWSCVLNVVSTATLPLSFCLILNMLLGLLWWPLTAVTSIVALFASVILLYAGFQKLEKPVTSPFYPFIILLTILVSVTILLSFLLYGVVFSSWSNSDEVGFSYIFYLIFAYFMR